MKHSLSLFIRQHSRWSNTSGEPVVGITYLPWTGETFFAYEEGGSYLNDWKTKMELINDQMHETTHRCIVAGSDELMVGLRGMMAVL